MNDRPSGVPGNDKGGMHDIGRSILMGGGSSGQTVVATTTTPGPLNGLSASSAAGLEATSSSASSSITSSSSGNSNGIHHHHLAVSSSGFASLVDGATPSALINNNINNNCLKRSQVIKCSSSGGRNSEESHVLQVTMSDGPASDREPVHQQQQQKPHKQPARPETATLTVSSSSSGSSSAVSSRSSSLSVSPNPMMLIRSSAEEEEVVEDSRKVEPLKINLHHREPIRTVIKLGGQSPVTHNHNAHATAPKITFKPIPSHVPVVSSTNDSVDLPSAGAAAAAAIPKLTIRNATTSAAAVETGMVASTTTTTTTATVGAPVAVPEPTTVPKLTIKMAQPVTVVVAAAEGAGVAVPRLTIKTNSLGGRAIGEGSAPQSELLTVPKLTIKVSNDQASNSTAATSGGVSPGSGMITSSSGSASNSSSVPDGGAIPKLTLKTVSRTAIDEHHASEEAAAVASATPSFHIVNSTNDIQQSQTPQQQAMVPKLKVKLQRPVVPSKVVVEEDEEEEESEVSNSEAEEVAVPTVIPPRIPKLTIKPVVSPPKTTYGTNQQSAVNSSGDHHHQHPEVPKLVIKSIPKPEHSAGGDNQYQTATNHHRVTTAAAATTNDNVLLPLDVSSTASVGPQSPRIILKINKSHNSIVSNTTEVNEEENLLKRHLQEHVNSTPKRSKAEERIIAVIDLDEEESSKSSASETTTTTRAEGEKNGRSSRRLLGVSSLKKEAPEGVEIDDGDAMDCETSNSGVEEETVSAKQLPVTLNNNCTQIVPENRGGAEVEEKDPSEDSEEKDVVDEAAKRLRGPEVTVEETPTSMVKRGRGRPRKTPVVAREVPEDCNSNIMAVPETSKKRGRKKKEEESESQVPATESTNVSEEEGGLPSPATFTPARKPRGGGRGGGAAGVTRTPSTRGGGSAAKRGRGSARKPFNKQQYFKQKTFEETIINSYFEEDTRMSAADSSLSTPKVALSVASQIDPQDSVSQSSHLSSASVTMDSTQTSSMSARKKLKMEMLGTIEGKAEFTVDMLAEYVWPPSVGCLLNKNRDTFMIQEQVAEYLGVKSFKRKYPDLERRIVEMEERNHLIEKGLVTEKMCDLGVTAVYAVDVLDIMHQDFHEKYEQYKTFHREKLARDLTLRQKLARAELGLGAREKAMRSVSKWNASLNRTRKEDRRLHMDLQNFTIQVPEAKRKNMTYPTQKPPLYPVALVVGQFSEYYRTYSPMELQCYPINTALTNPEDLMKRLLEEKMRKRRADDEANEQRDVAGAAAARATGATEEAEQEIAKSSSESSSSDESNDSDEDSVEDSSSSESDCDVHDDDVCCVCAQSQFTSPSNIPELFVKCAICLKVAHPSCIEMSTEMAKRAFQYQWQCVECKRCHGCQKSDDQQKMIYCQQCDRAYHIYCTKSLQAIPKGMWHCDICSICRKCGCRNPDGTNNKIPKQLMAGSSSQQQHRRPEWKHEFVKNEGTGLREHCGMLCLRCVSS